MPLTPGQPNVFRAKKEIGRQLIMLDAYRVADATGLGTRFADLESVLTQLAIGKAYYAKGNGYLYEMTYDFLPLVITRAGVVIEVVNWVTSEADGAALEALFALSDSTPW